MSAAAVPRDAERVGAPFWALFAVNYVVMGLVKYVRLPIPASLLVELFYFAALIHALRHNARHGGTMRMAFGPLLAIYSVWLCYALLEVANTASGIDYALIFYRWAAEFRNLALQFVYGVLLFACVFNSRRKIRKYHYVWGVFALLSVAKTLGQQHLGFDAAERAFLVDAARTHFVNGIIRYFSFFSDAANYGSSMAATCVVFSALSFTTAGRRARLFFALVSLASLYGMMASGTRSSIIALAAGLLTYAALSKRFAAFLCAALLGMATVGFLVLTDIGQGNYMIRRMRSAFNKNDASLAVREVNKLAMKRYLDEVPAGIGAGIMNGDIPPSNKNYFLSVVPPDSTWVYVHIRYGMLGEWCFLFSFFGVTAYGAYVTLRKVRHKEVAGQMAATVSGAAAMTMAGYTNHIMLQYPNCLVFFGALGMLAVARVTDRKALEEDEERARLSLARLREQESLPASPPRVGQDGTEA